MAGAEPFRFAGSADDAVLLIHGFTGTPFEMRPLGEFLAERGIASICVLLRGHGTHPDDMLDCRYRDWLADAETALAELLVTHARAYLVGLSMGGTIALNLAARRADDPRVAGVVAINAPVRLVDWRLGMARILTRLIRWQAWGKPDIKDTRAWEGHVAYRRFRSRTVHELLALLRETAGLLARVSQPVLVIQARRDNVVPPLNAGLILEGVGGADKRVVWLEDSYHVATVDFDAPKVKAEVARFIDEHRPSGSLAPGGVRDALTARVEGR